MTRETVSPRKPKVMRLGDAHSIAYVDAGDGDALLFVHGSLCDYRYWRPQFLGLSDRFHVVMPSLSHYHPRLPSMAGTPFSWQAHAELIAALIRHLNAPALHLVGHSRGAAIAYQVALQYPGLVDSLALVDPAGPSTDDGPEAGFNAPALRTLRERAADFIAAGEIDRGLELFVDSTSRPGFWKRSAAQFQEMARDNAWTLPRQFSDPLPAYTRHEAAGIGCATLLVAGARSPAMYRDNASLLHQWIPGARAATIQGASHGMNWSHPEEFAQELASFARLERPKQRPVAGFETP